MLDEDRRFYLDTLRGYCERYGLTALGYCLMTNHVHLTVVPERPDALAQALGNTHQLHAQRFNRRYGRSGHVWQNRLFSCPLGPDRVAPTLAYGDLNPVRAGLVGAAEQWPCSSARAHSSRADDSGLLDLEACRRWCALERWAEILTTGGYTTEGELLCRATAGGFPWGDDEFLADLERAEERSLRPQRVRTPRPKARGASA